MNRRPAFQFYPADWRKDPELRVCSLAARGLWMEMICIQHECERYGHLMVANEPVSDAQLARLVGEPVRKIRRLLAELETHTVFSRTEEGVIHSRRMVHDEHIRQVRAEAGKLGGNPHLLVKQTAKQDPTPSSSSSSSTSVGKRAAPEGARAAGPTGSLGEELPVGAEADEAQRRRASETVSPGQCSGPGPNVIASGPLTLETHVPVVVHGDTVSAPDPGGEYLAVTFLRGGGIGVVTPIENAAAHRLGFSFWRFAVRKAELRRGVGRE